MKCPKCQEEMAIIKKDISHSDKNKKKYLRTIFHCKKDDVWSNLEIPKE